ncbi:phage portal protein [Corynebacterium sp. AOP34-BR1-29]|uniref:phage portal protein n=1 Tax=Corynebacterium sp. AOP34-BR1-29 TaxID=3457688 RepID=UPI00403334E8
MGLLDYFGISRTTYQAPEPDELAAPIFAGIARDIDKMSVEQLWEEQPHLRTVVDFIARSIASVNLHAYKRDADGGRERVRNDRVATLMKKASPSMLTYDLIYRSLMDLSLYDEFIWVVDERSDTGYRITSISPTWQVRYKWRDAWTMKSMLMTDPSSGDEHEFPADQVVRIHGYHPFTMKRGSSPVEALKDTLREQLEGASYRSQLWKSGARLGGVITRPKDAAWDAKARRRFKAAWQSQYTGRGSGAGGTPILEDGMEFKPAHLKAQDEQVVDMTKLSLQTVASVYHINPTMIGLLDNANYSNVREFRRSLYGDSLGPQIKRIEDALNQWALPALGVDPDIYVEFNLEEKLRASFEEKAAVTSTAVGAPWMTVNEARGMNNLPHLDGGDQLARPLNTAFGAPGDDTEDTEDQDDEESGGEGQ